MRIIAGLAKGRTIDAVSSSTRPTSDRAREALFSTLASEFGDFDGLVAQPLCMRWRKMMRQQRPLQAITKI